MVQVCSSEQVAGEELVVAARRLFADGNVKIHDNATVTWDTDGGAWVQGWLLVPRDDATFDQSRCAASVVSSDRYVLRVSDGRMVTTETVELALTYIPVLARVWTDAAGAERQRQSLEVLLGESLVVDLLHGTNPRLTVVHTCPDGQVFGVEDLGDGEYGAVYPDQFAELSGVWASKASALDTVEAHVVRYLSGDLSSELGEVSDVHERLANEWLRAHGEAAAREGWSIFEVDGCDNGRWQLCRIDDAEGWSQSHGGGPVRQLSGDGESWIIVSRGNGPHHRAALALLAIVNPTEVKAIADFVGGHTSTARTRP